MEREFEIVSLPKDKRKGTLIPLTTRSDAGELGKAVSAKVLYL